MSLPVIPVARIHYSYRRNDAILLADCGAFIAAICVAGFATATASMGLRPAVAALQLLFVIASNFSYRCHDANLSFLRAAFLTFVVVAGITGFSIAEATPGTCYFIVVLSTFITNVVNNIAAAPLAAVGFAVGTSVDAVAVFTDDRDRKSVVSE